MTNVTYKELKKLNLKINTDGIIGITGENKDILLEIMSLEKKTKGTITYNREKITDKNIIELRKKTSYVPFSFTNIYNKTTIEEYMLYMIYYTKLNIKDPNKKIIDSLKIVDLQEEYLTRDINTLSTCEKRKFQIALSLITNPKLILLENPYVDLDAVSRKKLYRLLNQINEKYKIGIIFTTNNSDILYKYTKTAIILKNNQIYKIGDTKEVYNDVDTLLEENIEIPDIVLFTYKVRKNKNKNIDYHRDIRDLIKDIYKHV